MLECLECMEPTQSFPQISLLQHSGSTSEEARPMKSTMKSLQLGTNKARASSLPNEAQHFYLRALALEKKHLGARPEQGGGRSGIDGMF